MKKSGKQQGQKPVVFLGKRITPALIVGLLMAFGVVAAGLYAALGFDEYRGYFAAGVGAAFVGLVWGVAR